MEQCSVELYHSLFDVPCWARHMLIWVHQHQIILSALAAGYAAWRTIKNIKKQIEQNENFRIEDNKKELKHNVRVFVSEYSEMVNEVLNYYKHIKTYIPLGFKGQLWTRIPHLFELEREQVVFRPTSYSLFMNSEGSNILTDLLILQGTRNRLASITKTWNQLKRSGEDMFIDSSNIDAQTGEIKTAFDLSNPKHKRFDVEAESLLNALIFMGEEQVREIILQEENLVTYLSLIMKDPDFQGYTVTEDYKTWFKENSSDI